MKLSDNIDLTTIKLMEKDIDLFFKNQFMMKVFLKRLKNL